MTKRQDIKHKKPFPSEDENLSEEGLEIERVPEQPDSSESESEEFLPKEDEMIDPEKDPSLKNFARRK